MEREKRGRDGERKEGAGLREGRPAVRGRRPQGAGRRCGGGGVLLSVWRGETERERGSSEGEREDGGNEGRGSGLFGWERETAAEYTYIIKRLS